VERKRIVLEGDPPSAINPPPGCPFQTRCRWKKFVPDNLCETELPPFRDLGAGHRSLCWLNDEQLATQEPVIRFDKSKPEDPSTVEPTPGTRVTTAPVAKEGEAAEVASETADPASPAHEALAGSPPSGTKGRRKAASAVPGRSDPAVSEDEVGDGREGVSASVRPGTIGHEAPAEPDSGTTATAPAKANEGGSREETRPAARSGSGAGRPQGITRPAQPDDLKLISGVGPGIETRLNDLGIYTYGQIAAWEKAETQWVDEYLSFRGRIERDDWVRQARALAEGGEAEYIRVFGKKPR
jgi:peptide/nickel transport system ATP-binding protein